MAKIMRMRWLAASVLLAAVCACVVYASRPKRFLLVDLSAGPDAIYYPTRFVDDIPEGVWTDEDKTTRMVFRRIPAGTFVMGSPATELGRYDKNEDRRRVVLTKGFYIGVFEVTQRQWERVMGTWPSDYRNPTFRDARPLDQITYSDIRGFGVGTNWPSSRDVDADSFMGRLRARTGLAFDLPTEAQWEYACRAGTVTALNSGRDLAEGKSDRGMDMLGRYYCNGAMSGHYHGIANYDGDTSMGTAKAGSYLPNAWGLYDMHGNAYEWCLDWYEDSPRGLFDPKGPARGKYRLERGGAWFHIAWGCRSAARCGTDPLYRGSCVGFRCALP